MAGAGCPTGYVLVELPDTIGALVTVRVAVDFAGDTVADLKQRLFEERGIPVALQSLTFAGGLRGGGGDLFAQPLEAPPAGASCHLWDADCLSAWGLGATFQLWRTDYTRVYIWMPDETLVRIIVPKNNPVSAVVSRLRHLVNDWVSRVELTVLGAVLDMEMLLADVLADEHLFGHWRLRMRPLGDARGFGPLRV